MKTHSLSKLRRCRLSLITLFVLILVACGGHKNSSNSFGKNNGNTAFPSEKYAGSAFEINDAFIKYESSLDALVFTLEANANVASVVPEAAGQVDGAPVLGYVFVTSLSPEDIGYGDAEGTVALAVTSHPDFDDTPLWNENNNDLYDDDGVVYHSHWVVLVENELAGEGLAVLQASDESQLTPTSPMPMYLDSPGFTVLEKDKQLHIIVPLDRVNRNAGFSADALTAYLEVDLSDDAPLLKVEKIYDMYSNDLSLPLTVTNAELAPASAWPALSTDESPDSFALTNATVDYLEDIETFVFSMDVAGDAAIQAPEAIGSINEAPVLGYVFPTTLSPSSVGFSGQEGILALAVTSHPDFDDTPLWDENRNDDFGDDGIVYHVHWVVLIEDSDSAAGLSVPSSFNEEDLPPTAPMPMYLDSPGFHAFSQGGRLSVIVPAQRIDYTTAFKFDGVTAKMNVDASGEGPVLRVNEVIDILSGDLSLPFTVNTTTLDE